MCTWCSSWLDECVVVVRVDVVPIGTICARAREHQAYKIYKFEMAIICQYSNTYTYIRVSIRERISYSQICSQSHAFVLLDDDVLLSFEGWVGVGGVLTAHLAHGV